MRDKFKNKNGDLTHYALACGYIQKIDISDFSIVLWHEGGPCFHVSMRDNKNNTRVFWKVFENLTSARKYWHQTKRNISELSKMQ